MTPSAKHTRTGALVNCQLEATPGFSENSIPAKDYDGEFGVLSKQDGYVFRDEGGQVFSQNACFYLY